MEHTPDLIGMAMLVPLNRKNNPRRVLSGSPKENEFIREECHISSGSIGNLYAELDGNVSPVSIVGPNRYQVSWTEEPKTARKGKRVLRIFDEDFHTVYRKASHAEEDVSAVPALFNVVVNHPGASNGPWLKSEFIATVLSLVLAYFAVVSKSKVIS
ncbi:hypothetical protein JTB14_016408 [Gonioctena quinquepunctata]|nr:hypothetical protein JTB14_016408 [Gonioctena quinquepunctata]